MHRARRACQLKATDLPDTIFPNGTRLNIAELFAKLVTMAIKAKQSKRLCRLLRYVREERQLIQAFCDPDQAREQAPY